MSSMIGIKVADGEFYPIVEENSGVTKRLVLTTAHDSQKTVQIDLFSSATETMEHSRYIGTIVVDGLTGRQKGEASIEVLISAGSDGEVSAEAYDTDNNSPDSHHRLSVFLNALSKQDADIDYGGLVDGLDTEEKKAIYLNDTPRKAVQKGAFIALVAVAACAVLLLLWFLVFRNMIGERDLRELAPPTSIQNTEQKGVEELAENNPAPKNSDKAEPVASSPEMSGEAAADPLASELKKPVPPKNTIIEMPKKTETPLIAESRVIVVKGTEPVAARAPVTKTKPAYPVPKTGDTYKLRWGDTLWDVSKVYYRNPWYYKYLASFNRIANPNNIKAGRTINIPPLPAK
ncbi:MAG: LysM peptidoglycan-binding domain-containing protein [Termitinemataceae bacterium]|nr:MAG: LysM peptidoglycan-binding domain-containing protein [Termitinemataceae bacterium]